MTINLEHRHHRAISHRALDTIIETSFYGTPSSRHSTASTQSSFSTAYTTLEVGSSFRYYLPHISTLTSPVYTRNESYAYQMNPRSQDLRTEQVGRFYHYIPNESTEQDDVYTDGVNTIVDAPRGKGTVQITPEPKVLGNCKDVVFYERRTPAEIKSPLLFIGPTDFSYYPRRVEVNDVDVGNYTAGENLSTGKPAVDGGDGEVKKQRNKLKKDQHRRSQSVADCSSHLKQAFKMPSLLNMMKSRKATDDEEVVNASMHPRTGKGGCDPSRARPQSVKSTSHSAACCGFCTTPSRRPTDQQRSRTRSAHFKESGRASEDDDPNNPIIKFSMYPPMVGKRRSELETYVRTRSLKQDRVSTEVHRREDTTRTGRPVCRQQISSHMQSRSAKSDLFFDSGYSSDGNPEDRTVRVYMHPQAKYIKKPVKTPLMPPRVPAPSGEDMSFEGP
ncbi:hypothetical protein BU25DRAFT_476777 [Macroventuria anomochaeta]|uniref:Uncharacterized protein n=1 Tax=Macroventuria anomochaeta TaxID=301207 RepID=A0ACB6RQR7_9PLEO|nr:uncharacterized protein BU25DRAFT_476777 [Macroventuria anomochaeta]KAF2624124.1 hypothetical protein BU25DRAFT_476777 [Macroventuria anomochaeta]